ncbi:xylulokinase [Microbacterium sp. gxy059]|uniref:xylulokinase n=1 Tax=Microbacterium sp. gxy059 TaxID=2957199 RepID=UPI003D95851B
MTLVLGVDLSTQACTAEVRDAASFAVVGTAREPLAPTAPPVSEQRAGDWWEALRRCTASLRAQGVELGDIAAVSVAGQCHGLVPLDGAGEAIRPVKLWNDTTSSPQTSRLLDRVGREEFARRVGSVPTAAFTIGKLAWLLEEEPETIARLARVVLPHDYLTYRLTGEFATDRSEASGTGYFDAVRMRYDHDLLRECFGSALAWEGLFPEVRGPSETAGQVTRDAAEALGLRSGIPVAVGGGDQHVAALGLGIRERDVAFSLGTSGVVFASSARPVMDPSGWVDGVANAVGGWLPLVCTLNATKVTDWMARLLGVDVVGLGELALSAGAGSGPILAAYLDGERSPSLPDARALLCGIVGADTRETVARAAFQGVLMGLMRGRDAIADCGVPVDGRVIAVGGGARSAAYTQLLADLIGGVVSVIDEPEATARGACVQALAVLERRDVAETGRLLAPAVEIAAAPRVDRAQWEGLRAGYERACRAAAETSAADVVA